ncbi:DUF3299 domain-containing protein [Vibrio parahaemolyticus]|uniref:DUF3299 domain-containing protein n=1 Tax=Vibrio parahaemolyticus TaxID=670 RepID=UPI00273406C6|nr:DUF3299 domain-containing protein [Vibrio parahaemolyticus]WLI87217.1 DUF3299 domain-containing protein [Vibrio parahaemolyticus]
MKNLLLMLALITPLTHAADTLSWDSLRPQNTQQQSLSPSDKALVTEIYVYEVAQQSRKLSPMEHDGYIKRIELAEKRGLNVRGALDELVNGKRYANAIIPDLQVNDMKLGGFLVPLEMEGLVGTQFILVPTAGACIHTPPPPANQTILVDFPEGYQMQSLYTPVWVEGDIKAGEISASVALSDGNQDIEIGYVIDASDIVTYQ